VGMTGKKGTPCGLGFPAPTILFNPQSLRPKQRALGYKRQKGESQKCGWRLGKKKKKKKGMSQRGSVTRRLAKKAKKGTRRGNRIGITCKLQGFSRRDVLTLCGSRLPCISSKDLGISDISSQKRGGLTPGEKRGGHQEPDGRAS